MGNYDLSRIRSMNLSLNPTVIDSLLSPEAFNLGNYGFYQHHINNSKPISSNGNEGNIYENPFTLPPEILRNINNYRFIYNEPLVNVFDVGTQDGGKDSSGNVLSEVFALPIKTATTASLFNPLFNIQVLGITNNVPLLNDVEQRGKMEYYDTSDCSIKTLVKMSNAYNSELGQAKYRYTDFMYCKELGKIANNHLITLRKFPYPIGDNIFETTSPMYRTDDGVGDYDIPGDVGRLVTWFGTEDNKLEDILKYNYKATWKELNAKIDYKDSQEDNADRGIIGSVLNTFNPAYNNMAGGGFAGTQNLVSKVGSKIFPKVNMGSTYDNNLLRNYDNNKVYEPKDTVQNTHIYEGKLQFEHEFSITFNYKLRAYENINPKSAMLDLLGNIYEVTYKRGKFWGGAQKIVGPPPNVQGWKKANAFIDEQWDKLGGFIQSIANGTSSLGDILGQIGAAVGSMVNSAVDGAKNLASKGLGAIAQDTAKGLINLNDKYKISEAIKGKLKNALGRPALYAFDSLLPEGLSGLWHVTIGNPRNPIVSIGNLILTNAVVQHSGPLGIDDFPTELKVTVTLKHAKGRDLTSVSKMYTRGLSSIYMSNAHNNLKSFYSSDTTTKVAASDDKMDRKSPSYTNKGLDLTRPEVLKQFKVSNGFNNGNHLMDDTNAFRVMTNQDRAIVARSVIDEIA